MSKSSLEAASDAAMHLSLGGLNENESALFVCDMQEKFRNAMLNFDAVTHNTKKLIAGCSILEIPIVVTEQYPKGLGSTVPELELKDDIVSLKVEKTQFNMITPEVGDALTTLCNGMLTSVILCGVECHVCVEQTAIELLARGIKVHVVADCTTSRTALDRGFALKRLSQIGCFVSTSETVLFKVLRTKDHPKFKQVSQLVRQTSLDTDLMSSL